MQTDKETIHILVAENLPIVRDGLVSQLEHLTTVHVHPVSISTKQSLRSLLGARNFNFLFISPDFDGGFDLSEFRRDYASIPCIAILSELKQLRFCNGYYDCITIFDSAEKILSLIVNYQKTTQTKSSVESPDVLSTREKEILACLAKGLSNKEVADKLCLSVYTVMTHRRNICQKLQIHSLSGLTIYAIANKLIEV